MFGLFKTKHQPREFNYKPRFYDPDREALQARIEQREGGGYQVARHFDDYRRRRRQPKSLVGGSTLRIVLIFAALILLAYATLEFWLPRLMNFWFPGEEF